MSLSSTPVSSCRFFNRRSLFLYGRYPLSSAPTCGLPVTKALLQGVLSVPLQLSFTQLTRCGAPAYKAAPHQLIIYSLMSQVRTTLGYYSVYVDIAQPRSARHACTVSPSVLCQGKSHHAPRAIAFGVLVEVDQVCRCPTRKTVPRSEVTRNHNAPAGDAESDQPVKWRRRPGRR